MCGTLVTERILRCSSKYLVVYEPCVGEETVDVNTCVDYGSYKRRVNMYSNARQKKELGEVAAVVHHLMSELGRLWRHKAQTTFKKHGTPRYHALNSRSNPRSHGVSRKEAPLFAAQWLRRVFVFLPGDA